MSKKYYKLVRDKIPQIIEATGKACRTEVLSERQYIAMLDEKLDEELQEYQESKALEELADLIEVIAAVAQARDCSWDQLMQIRDEKRQQRGGFEKKLMLLEVCDLPKSNQK